MLRLFITLLFSTTFLARGATYYIDYAGGNDAANGLSTVTAWKTHPYMRQGAHPSYVHATGDSFVFKGGVTWPNACFTMQITAGGAAGNPDHYTTDVSWYSGPAYTPPHFDAQGIELAGAFDVMLMFSPTTTPHHVSISGIDFTGLYWSGNKAYGWVAYVNLQISHDIIFNGCTFRNWSHAPMPTTDQLKVIIGANSAPFNPGCIIQNCNFDGENADNATQGRSSGEATYAYSGNVLNCTFRNIASGTIVTGDPVSVTPQVVSSCEFGPVYMSYDSAAHPDGLFMNGGNLFYWHDNYIHDCYVESVFAGNGSGAERLYLWNNVIWNCKTSPAIIENNFYAGAQLYVWNNTIASGSLYCIRNVNRGVGPLGVLDMRNNLFITDAGVLLQDPGASITSLTNQNNITLSTSAAFVQGYSESNRYQPTSGTAPTVNTGLALPSLLGGVLTTDILGIVRPQGLAWDVGAYEFLGIFGTGGNISMATDAISVGPASGLVGITVIRTGGTSGAVTASVSTDDGTATAGVDYTATATTLTWADGATGARSFTVPILNANALTNRGFFVNITNVTGNAFIVEPDYTFVTIVPPQIPTDPGTVTFAPVNYSTVPTAGTVTLSVIRSGSTNTDLSIDYATANGTATAGVDYTTTTGTLSWSTNENSVKTITVPIINSGATGTPRTFTVTLSNPSRLATVNNSVSTVTIVLPTPQPGTLAFSSSSTFVSQNGTNVTITVQRTGGTNGAVSVTAATSNQSAVSGHDYTAVSTNLTWADTVAGTVSFLVPILASGDTATTNRTFLLTLSSPTGGATLANPFQEVVTIIMNPPIVVTNAGSVTLSATNYVTTSTNANVVLTVLRTGSTNMAASINYATANGTATAGVDYTTTTGTLSWATNINTAQTITVPLINSGATGTNRVFRLSLSGASTGVTLGITNATVTINLPPTPIPGTLAFSSAATSVSENSTNVTITVVRSGGTNGVVSVTAATSNQTATAGHDYTSVSTNLSWGDTVFGNVSFTIPILQSGDTANTNRTFLVTLSSPTGGATLASPFQEVVTIIMNPWPTTNGGVFNFSAPSYSTTETSGNVTITVSRTGSTNIAATVRYFTSNGSATAGFDYTTVSNTLAWGVNENSSKTFTVPILNSGSIGPARVFYVNLTGPTGGATLGRSQAAVSIAMNASITVTNIITARGNITFRGSMVLSGQSP